MQVSRCFQGCLGTCAHRGAGIRGNEIDAQPSDNGVGVVFVQTVEGEAVVEQSRRFKEHLTSDLEVHLGPCLGYCLSRARNWSNGGFTGLAGMLRASQCAHGPASEYRLRTGRWAIARKVREGVLRAGLVTVIGCMDNQHDGQTALAAGRSR